MDAQEEKLTVEWDRNPPRDLFETDEAAADRVSEDARILQELGVIEEAQRRLGADREVWALSAFFGSIAAVIVLLWNIVWHIGHWVWMGRRTAGETNE